MVPYECREAHDAAHVVSQVADARRRAAMSWREETRETPLRRVSAGVLEWRISAQRPCYRFINKCDEKNFEFEDAKKSFKYKCQKGLESQLCNLKSGKQTARGKVLVQVHAQCSWKT